MVNNDSLNWVCKCNKIWNILVVDKVIHLSNRPQRRKVGHCYCGKQLMKNWEGNNVERNKKFHYATSAQLHQRHGYPEI